MKNLLSILIISLSLSLVGCYRTPEFFNTQTADYVQQYTKDLYNHPYVSCLNASANVQYSPYDRDSGYLGVMSIKWLSADGELLETTQSKHKLSLQTLDNEQIVMLFLPKKDYCTNKG